MSSGRGSTGEGEEQPSSSSSSPRGQLSSQSSLPEDMFVRHKVRGGLRLDLPCWHYPPAVPHPTCALRTRRRSQSSTLWQGWPYATTSRCGGGGATHEGAGGASWRAPADRSTGAAAAHCVLPCRACP